MSDKKYLNNKELFVEPLFENTSTIGRAELLEWCKNEISRGQRGYQVVSLLLGVVCLVVAGWCVSVWRMLGGGLFIAGAAVMAVMAVLVVAGTFLRYRFTVWNLLRKDKTGTWPSRMVCLFYPQSLTVMQLAEDEGAARAYVEKAAGLQKELAALAAQAKQLDKEAAGEMEAFRTQLADLKGRMDGLNGELRTLGTERRLPYGGITGYMQTPNLHVLYYEDAAVMLRKDGFAGGADAAFRKFLEEKLLTAAAGAEDANIKKGLLKAVADYLPKER